MSCPSCGSNSCFCIPQCSTECPEATVYSAENINLAGVGVLDGTENQVFQFRGIRSTNNNITVALNADFNTVDLTLDNDTFQGTETFANAATRANTVPEFDGQVGVQLDTNDLYTAFGVAAGNWEGGFFRAGRTTDTGAIQTTIRLLNAAPFTVDGGANVGVLVVSNLASLTLSSILALNISNGVAITVSATSSLQMNGTANFDNQVSFQSSSLTTFDLGSVLNFAAGSEVQTGGSAIPANSLVRSSSNAGELTSQLIAEFLSDENTNVYGAVTGTLSRAAYATYTAAVISNPPTQAEVQAVADALQVLSRLVGAILTDLQDTLKPSL